MNDICLQIYNKYRELKEQNFFDTLKLEKNKELEACRFYDRFSIENIKKAQGKDILMLLFQPNIGLTMTMEFKLRDRHGSFTGTDYDKSPVSYSSCKTDTNFSGKAWRIEKAKISLIRKRLFP